MVEIRWPDSEVSNSFLRRQHTKNRIGSKVLCWAEVEDCCQLKRMRVMREDEEWNADSFFRASNQRMKMRESGVTVRMSVACLMSQTTFPDDSSRNEVVVVADNGVWLFSPRLHFPWKKVDNRRKRALPSRS